MQFQFDPFDMLQEHDLNIQRLIKAHNTSQTTIAELLKHQAELYDEIAHLHAMINQMRTQLRQ